MNIFSLRKVKCGISARHFESSISEKSVKISCIAKIVPGNIKPIAPTTNHLKIK